MRFLANKVKKTADILKRAAGKSPRVLFVRGLQEARLFYMQNRKTWAQLDNTIREYWSKTRVDDVIKNKKTCLFADDSLTALHKYKDEQRDATIHYGTKIAARDFDILNAPVPKTGNWDWISDWRFDHKWPNQYFKDYTHHETREKPYDVKYPWELSRLGFLPAQIQAGLLSGQPVFKNVIALLKDWDDKNPLAYSINWYPMEVAMRSLNLIQVFDMLQLSDENNTEYMTVLLQLLTSHGEFLWRTIEDTDNRGNHYTANIVALLALGCTLQDHYPAAKTWTDYAVKNIEKEILAQFTADGVNFEMSTGYHRLVTELFLTAVIILNKQDQALSDTAQTRLKKACLYCAAYIRPDGYAPIVGDCDDAFVFHFEDKPHRDHSLIPAIGAILFPDAKLKQTDAAPPIALAWLFGDKGVETYNTQDTTQPNGRHFEQGGVVIARNQDNYLFMDVGPVGQNGLGGHGHNDILSFELCLNGIPLIIDPGCYIYSGDKEARNRFRSTAAHNTIMLDAHEISRFNGPFRLHNDAKPQNVTVGQNGQIWDIAAKQTGYHRLSPSADIKRIMCFDAANGSLHCQDIVTTDGDYTITRFFHLPPNIRAELAEDNTIILTDRNSKTRFTLIYDENSRADLIKSEISLGYGQKQKSHALRLTNKAQGNATDLRFKISS